MRIGLVGCVKTKLAVPAPAEKLYVSELFAARRKAVERSCDRWFVLSARHGLLRPDDVVEPYDETLRGKRKREKQEWSARVAAQLIEELGGVAGHIAEFHAGGDYCDHDVIERLQAEGAEIEWPVKGLPIGRQRQFYKQLDVADREPRAASQGT